MSLSTTPEIGRWTDHSRHHHTQILLDDHAATWVKVLATGLALLSTPYIFLLVRNTILEFFFRPPSKPPGSPVSLTSRARNSVRNSKNVGTLLRTSKSGREVAWELAGVTRNKRTRMKGSSFFWALSVLSLIFAIFAAQVVLIGYLLSERDLGSDRAALLDSTICGLYDYDHREGGEEGAARDDILKSKKERRAAAYAQDCYGVSKDSSSVLCGFFYNSTIGYRRLQDKCPFYNNTICSEGYVSGSAVTFDTGLVDSDVLGINHSPTHKFRRKTTCAPLSADRPYVLHYTNSPSDHGYLYNYGSLWDVVDCSVAGPRPKLIDNFTMRISGHPFEWQAPSYRVNTYATSLLDPACDFYQPISALNAPGLDFPRRKTLTVIFVAALHILYSKKSNDPVFPSDKPFRYPGDSKDYYYNSDPRSKAFACIDETQLCAPSGSPCWTATDSIPDGVANTSAYWLMKYSLANSNTYDSIKLRLGSALLAQQRVGMSRSSPLPDDHWIDEAEQLFKTSLARAQFDAWSIASGEDHEDPTYMDTLPDEAKGNMCGMFKFNSVGYVNTLVWPLVILALLPLVTFLLSFETSWYVKEWQKLRGNDTTVPPPDSQSQNAVFTVGSSISSPRTSNVENDDGHPPAESSTEATTEGPAQSEESNGQPNTAQPDPELSAEAPADTSSRAPQTSDDTAERESTPHTSQSQRNQSSPASSTNAPPGPQPADEHTPLPATPTPRNTSQYGSFDHHTPATAAPPSHPNTADNHENTPQDDEATPQPQPTGSDDHSTTEAPDEHFERLLFHTTLFALGRFFKNIPAEYRKWTAQSHSQGEEGEQDHLLGRDGDGEEDHLGGG